MAELIAGELFAGRLSLTLGGVTLSAVELGPVTSVAPYRDQDAAVSTLLGEALGLPFPAPGEALAAGAARLLWVGPRRALLIGVPPPAGLADLAALTDQTDGQAVVRLDGDAAEAVLARLVPIDLRAAAFAEGRTARTLLGHMTASVTRTGPAGFELAVFRSMSGTLLHDLVRAMAQVAARD